MSIDRVILDFDHTLFDADDFKIAMATALRPMGVSEGLFWGTYRHARTNQEGTCSYCPEKHVALIAEKVLLEKERALSALHAVVDRSHEFLYPDAKEFLSRLISLGIPVTLLTHGDPAFQKRKIAACGIAPLIETIIATDQRKSAVVPDILRGTTGTVFFVNDHLDETVEVQKTNPSRIIPVLKRRPDQPPERYHGLGMLNFRTLSEIRDYLTIVHATNPHYGDAR
jgi:phosphoglycolate phosphatase-like HAD superfamily hydrolase